MRRLTAVLLSAALLAGCAGQQYWIPPSSAGGVQSVAGDPPGNPMPGLVAAVSPTLASIPSVSPTVASTTVLVAPSSVPPTLPLPTPAPPTLPPPTATIAPTKASGPAGPPANSPILYTAQAADVLQVVAFRFGVKPAEITSPDPIPSSGFINPGQLLVIPRGLGPTSSARQIIPDSEVVYSPSAINFNINQFVQDAAGRLSGYDDWLKSTGTISGSDMVLRVAIENSINPRLLLALTEFHGGWVYARPTDAKKLDYPLGLVNPINKGLYHQLVATVNELSVGYYAWREGRLNELTFPDKTKLRLSPDLNAGTVAVMYLFSKIYDQAEWAQALEGFPVIYTRMFGSPQERARSVEPLFPAGTVQPPLTLPFQRNRTWAFTGGPHGAWEHEGSYAALDFAPPSNDQGCVKSDSWVLASAAGLVVRSGGGVVVLDLDGDGHEQTGWDILFLHVSTEGRIPTGAWVDAGDQLGHPSCEGGQATGTHVHIARKFNGEWIPAGGPLPFNLGGWTAQAGVEAYKGILTRKGQTITACTCSNAPTFITRMDSDP
jgi:murein DD-endopeptidase MepM/ murein hydrolase activator NlpD